MTGADYEALQLVELLAVVSLCEDEETATRAAVECAAQAMEAEFACVVVDGRVVAAVGFGTSSTAVMTTVPPGRSTTIDIPGTGTCAAGAASFGDEGSSLLVIVRHELDFTVAEYNLIRGMARVLGLTLRMLHTLDLERRRRRVTNHLYTAQQALTRRVPLDEVLSLIVEGTRDVIGPVVTLWLVDAEADDRMTLAAGTSELERPHRSIVRTPSELVQRFSDAPEASGLGMMEFTLAAPVHEAGQVAGTLVVDRPTGPPFAAIDEEQLLTFAEHVSLALNSARTLHDIHRALHDSLTGLASRSLFLRDLSEVMADPSGIPVALMFIDLDRFKQVNDTLGHTAGDLVLAAVATKIKAVIRSGDLTSRLGGDEFAVLLRESPIDDAIGIAERLIAAVSEPIRVPGGRAEIGASVGVATAITGTDDPTAHDLVLRADTAMYVAKRSGRNRVVVFTAAMADEADHGRAVAVAEDAPATTGASATATRASSPGSGPGRS